MTVITKTSFEDDLEKIPAEISLRINSFVENKGKKNTFRYRVGDYRILMYWNKKTQILDVETVEHRKNVYKK
jgi:mRNA-degrading endonuclease RelE of RelBE toxin-antitoxin system